MPSAHDYTDAFRGTRALVTGGAGFIGSHLCARLVGLGAEVRVIDDLSTGNAANLDGLDVDLREASILDRDVVRDAMRDCRFVFHEAAMVSVPLSVEQPRECARVNIVGTHEILEAARDAGVHRLVFASSAAVYGGEPSLPSRESDTVDCRSPYAASKAAGEALASAFGCCYELSTVSLRYFNIFGPRQDPGSAYAAAIAAFHAALSERRRATVFGDGGQTRDFTPIENVVHANLLAATSPRDLTGQALNVGTGVRISLLDVLRHLGELLDADAQPAFADERAGDVRHSGADIARARTLLGYEPIVDFRTGLARLVGAERGA